MSIDAGGLAQMTYNSTNSNNSNGFPTGALGMPGAGFGTRSRLSNKRLSVALPPKVNSISENQVDNPTPRTSRSHLLAGLRTQPRTPGAVPASAPFNQSQHQIPGLGASRWAEPGYNNNNNNNTQNYHNVPQTATGTRFDISNQYAANAGRQMYSLPEQVLAPPSLYEQTDEMDPSVLQQMQLTSLFLAQRQQQLQQQLANITAAAQGMTLASNGQRLQYPPNTMIPAMQSTLVGQQVQEVPGQPGVYLIYNPSTQSYNYYVDPAVQQQLQAGMLQPTVSHDYRDATGLVSNSVPAPTEGATPPQTRSFTPPKKAPSPPATLDHVEPLPPPSATAFRRGHKKASSLAIDAFANAADGPKTSSAATFGSQRAAFPPTPMTGTFGPGAARAGEHPTRQPRGPPPLEELMTAPTSKHDGSKNFAARQRRRALDSLKKAGTQRRGASRSADGSPASEREFNFSVSDDGEDHFSVDSITSRKMSPIGSEMKEKRGSQGSSDGYFGLSSASSSEGEDLDSLKQPPTPATPVAGGDRKKMMLGVLSAAEKRRFAA